MTDEQKVREAFEAWALGEGYNISTYLDMELGETYRVDVTQDAWTGWQAAIAWMSGGEVEEIPVAFKEQEAAVRHITDEEISEWSKRTKNRHNYKHPPRAAEDAREDPVITLDKIDADGTEHYFVDGIGHLIPARHAIRYTHSLIQSMTAEDRAMIDQAIAGKRGG